MKAIEQVLRGSGAVFAFVAMAAIGYAVLALSSPDGSLLPGTPAASAATEAVGASPPPASTLPASGAAVLASASDFAAPRVDRSGAPLQCAIYARQRSGIALTGAARTWWAGAEGRYLRSHTPAAGAVIVMGGTESGHVAVVARVINARQIILDHSNWLGAGEIITGALAEDASEANDWSLVRVWNVETNSMGLRQYPVFGFVLPQPA